MEIVTTYTQIGYLASKLKTVVMSAVYDNAKESIDDVVKVDTKSDAIEADDENSTTLEDGCSSWSGNKKNENTII